MSGSPNPPHSSPGPRRPSPVERFLGADALRAGPFGLLRVPPDACTDERIVAALEWQLDRVAQHPEGDTPEADEVRLALHAAAAQLLDPNVRRHLLAALQSRGETGGVAQTPTTTGLPSGTRLTGLEQEAIRTLAAYGGWNKQSLERLRALAQAKGLGPHEVVQTLQNLSGGKKRASGQTDVPRVPRPPATPAPMTAMPTAQTRADDEPARPVRFVDPGQRYVRNLVLGVVGVMVCLGAAVVLAAILLKPPGAGTAPAGTGPVTTLSGPAPAPMQTPGTDAPRAGSIANSPPTEPARPTGKRAKPLVEVGDSVDPVALVRGLADCAAKARKEPELAAEQVPGLVRQLSARWWKLEQAQRRAADSAIMDVVFATASYPEVIGRVLDAVKEGAIALGGSVAMAPEDAYPAAWSVGMLSRMSRERELPHAVSSVVDEALTLGVGRDRPRTDTSFEGGAMAALRRLPDRLMAGEAPKGSGGKADGVLGPWLQAVNAIVGPDAELRERVLTDALQRVMVGGAEASADQRVFDAIQTLATEIKWRKGGAARARLLDWFKDPRVSMQDLQVLTAALASRSSAEGVDAMMVLSVGASPSDRQRLRTAYAKAWGIAESIGEDKASAAWLAGAKAELERPWDGLRRSDFLVTAVTVSRLNEAAAKLWRGDSEGVESLVSDTNAPTGPYMQVTGAQRSLTQHVEGDGQWTAGYASVGRNAALRAERLAQLESISVTLGPVDAEQVFYLACFETPVDLRVSAQKIVEKLSNEATLVNAALEVLPRAPRYASVGAMYERLAHRRLPAPGDEAWELEARRALVARLLELMAGAGEDAKVDDLSRVLFESYAVRAGREGVGEGPEGAEGGAQAGLDIAAELTRAWRAAAEAVSPNEAAPVPLDVIDRRRVGRLRLAQGPVQKFAAEQASAAELMAYVVAAEHPRLSAKVTAVMDDMAQGRRGATHIFEQIAQTERAVLRLWMLRLAGEQP